MTRTSQLAAHYAVIQVDAVLDHVMRSYIPTLELLVDEFHEQSEARQCDPFYSVEGHRSRRLALFTRYRAAVVALGEALGDIRLVASPNPTITWSSAHGSSWPTIHMC